MAAPPVAVDVTFVPMAARQKFTPLKQRVKKRLALAGAGLSAAALVAIAFLTS